MVLRSGSYTGTGSAQTIDVSDIGGQIHLVIIWNEAGNYANFSVFAKNGRSYELGNDSVAQTNAITNMSTTGFTVGTNADVNQSSDTFHYLVVRDNGAGDFAQGSYTGDASTPRSFTDPGFQPDFVMIRQDSDAAANGYDVYRTVGVSSSARFDTANITGRIISLDATGFTVDNSIDTNKNTIDYAWFAFKNTASKFKTTTYTGNGTDNTGITGVGFQPDYVIVHNRTSNALAVESDRVDAGDKTQIVRANAATTDIIQAMQSDGFQVGASARSNENLSTFNYMAWLAPAPVLTTTGPASFKNLTGAGK